MKLISRIKKVEHTKKDVIFLSANLDAIDTANLMVEIALSLPKASYCLRRQDNNLIDEIYAIYGNMLSLLFLSESFWLGIQVKYPEKFIVSFTHDMDSVKVI